MYRVSFENFENALNEVVETFNETLRSGVDHVAQKTVEEAKRQHPYTDRTGNLTRNIKAEPAKGSIQEGEISTTVVADTEYARKVEKLKGKILEPAYERVLASGEADIEVEINGSS